MAERKIYETQFALGAKVQSSMGKSFGQINQHIKGVEQQASKSAMACEKMSGTLKHLAEGAIAAFGIHEIMSFANEAANAAKEEMGNQLKLQTIMKQQTHATNDQIESVHKLIDAQTQNGIISVGVQIAGAQQLALYAKSTKSIQTLLPVMNNLLAQQKGVNASEEDAVMDAKAFGRALNGQAAGLSRMGIVLTKSQQQFFKTANEQQKVAMLAQLIQGKVGNMNKEFAKTDAGKLKEQENMLELIRVQIGQKIIPIQAKFAEVFLKMVPHIQEMLPLLDKIPPIIQKGVNILGFFVKHWSIVKPIILGVVTALLLYKAAIFVSQVQTGILVAKQIALTAAEKSGMIIGTLTKMYNTGAAALALLREGNSLAAVAQLVLNGTMWLCPITWIVAGIVALAAGAYLLIKNWKVVANFFKWLWKEIGGIWTKIFGGGNKTVNIKGAVNAPKPIPHHATGTNNFAGGLTWAGEKGIELLNLPRGTQIASNSRTKNLLEKLPTSGKGSSIVFSPVQNFYGPADREVVMQANKDSFSDFMSQLQRQQNLSFQKGVI